MTLKAWSYAVHGFILAASLFAAEASAQAFGITFAGAPSTIACTNTSFALGPGLT